MRRMSLRVALLDHSYGPATGSAASGAVRELAECLRAAGHRPRVLSSHPAATRRSVEGGIPVIRTRRLPEGLPHRRKLVTPLTQVPSTVTALIAGRYDVTHAFSPQDMVAALLWRRLVGRPAVFTCTEVLRRDRLADRRLRLRLLSHAVEHADAVTAPSEESSEALWRWLAVEAPVIGPGDARGHESMYRSLGKAASAL